MIEVEVVDGIGNVRLAHGKVNALDLELCQAIAETMRGLDTGDVRAVVLTGTGRAFSAGVDLHRIVAGGTGYVAEYLPALVSAFRAVFDLGKPVAALNGHAIAAPTTRRARRSPAVSSTSSPPRPNCSTAPGRWPAGCPRPSRVTPFATPRSSFTMR